MRRAERFFGTLAGKRAVVIGNGEMGRLAARTLVEAGCAVTVTLRTYRHGETVVPQGCATVPYDRRMERIEGADLVVSATTSPHFTLTAEQTGCAQPSAAAARSGHAARHRERGGRADTRRCSIWMTSVSLVTRITRRHFCAVPPRVSSTKTRGRFTRGMQLPRRRRRSSRSSSVRSQLGAPHSGS
ncbi:MAG: NAD(P)-dependent oxidoreductase [Butyricicoccaceae bacterium]